MARYRAYVCKAGYGLTQGKRLLLNIYNCDIGITFRDHNWVANSKRLQKIPDNTWITFTAKEEEYQSVSGIQKTLKHIRNITILKEKLSPFDI